MTLQDPLPEVVWIYEIDRTERTVTYRARAGDFSVELPLDPMHGTVGVAPANLETRHSLVPGAFGGNMDTPEMRAGATCYLGVNVEGAMFSIGDGHARQGEGETCGVAVETAMDTVITIDLIKGRTTPWPRLENDGYMITTGSARPLEDAFRIAHAEMVGWLCEEYRLTSSTRTSSSLKCRRARSRTCATRTTRAWRRCRSGTSRAGRRTATPTRS